MGLVMQEPTLFNYSIKENILYGDQTASNESIVNASDISNCRGFIESNELENAIEDNVVSLLAAMKTDGYKKNIIDKIGQAAYDAKLSIMTKLEKKESRLGKF